MTVRVFFKNANDPVSLDCEDVLDTKSNPPGMNSGWPGNSLVLKGPNNSTRGVFNWDDIAGYAEV